MTVYLFNVGQGDHLLLELPNGKYGLIDFHWDIDINPGVEPPGLTYLKHKHNPQNPVVISFICISHPHFDHTKGLKKVLQWVKYNKIEVERLWLYPGVNEKDVPRALRRAITVLEKIAVQNRASGIEVPPVGSDNVSQIHRIREDLEALWDFVNEWPYSADLIQGINHIDTINGLEVCALAPLSREIERANQDVLTSIYLWRKPGDPIEFPERNLLSSIIKLTFGEHQLLFGGDSGERAWERSLDEFDRKHRNDSGPCNSSYRASFIKASHHGSKHSSSTRMWERIIDAVTHVGISAGEGKNHPNDDTLNDVKTAAENLQSSAKLFTTNACKKCLVRPDVPAEPMPWLPMEPKESSNDIVRKVISDEAPEIDATGEGVQRSSSPHADEALKEMRPEPPKEEKPDERKALAAYIFRFKSKNREVLVSKAFMSCQEKPNCMFGYVGERHFPECVSPH